MDDGIMLKDKYEEKIYRMQKKILLFFQLSWLAQAIRYPDVFCFGDHPAHPVLIDCLKHPLDDTKETWTW